MRCYICDWSSGPTPSAYHIGVHDELSTERRTISLDDRGRPICSHCDALSVDDTPYEDEGEDGEPDFLPFPE